MSGIFSNIMRICTIKVRSGAETEKTDEGDRTMMISEGMWEQVQQW